MSETTTTHYVAIIQISLPGQATAVSANIRLTPTELVPVDGSYKTLHECTLAELQQFADQIEIEVWETYREIKLADLAKDSTVKMAMDVVDAAGEPVAPSREWLAQMVVETAVPAIIEEAPVAENNETEAAAAEEPVETEAEEVAAEEETEAEAETEEADEEE